MRAGKNIKLQGTLYTSAWVLFFTLSVNTLRGPVDRVLDPILFAGVYIFHFGQTYKVLVGQGKNMI